PAVGNEETAIEAAGPAPSARRGVGQLSRRGQPREHQAARSTEQGSSRAHVDARRVDLRSRGRQVMDERTNAMKAPRVAGITGAPEGMGRVTAEQFSAAGYLVAAVDVQPQVADVAEQLRARGSRAVHAIFDVSDPLAVADGFASVVGELGPVDVLVNN